MFTFQQFRWLSVCISARFKLVLWIRNEPAFEWRRIDYEKCIITHTHTHERTDARSRPQMHSNKSIRNRCKVQYHGKWFNTFPRRYVIYVCLSVYVPLRCYFFIFPLSNIYINHSLFKELFNLNNKVSYEEKPYKIAFSPKLISQWNCCLQ